MIPDRLAAIDSLDATIIPLTAADEVVLGLAERARRSRRSSSRDRSSAAQRRDRRWPPRPARGARGWPGRAGGLGDAPACAVAPTAV